MKANQGQPAHSDQTRLAAIRQQQGQTQLAQAAMQRNLQQAVNPDAPDEGKETEGDTEDK